MPTGGGIIQKPFRQQPKGPRRNRRIFAPEVRVIDETGEQRGILPIKEALHLAEEKGLDLVEIAPQATPPVCKVVDYGKYLYDLKKQQKKAKKKQKIIRLHEMKFGARTEEHDLSHKLRKIEEFLDEGDKVKMTVFFKGRQMQYREMGMALLNKVAERLKEIAVIELPARYEGRILFMVIAPNKPLTSKKK